MAKRKTTLKKKVSKRQTRKFSKKGGSKKGGSKKGGSKKGGSKKNLVGGLYQASVEELNERARKEAERNKILKSIGEKIVKEVDNNEVDKVLARFEIQGGIRDGLRTPIDAKNINELIQYLIKSERWKLLHKILINNFLKEVEDYLKTNNKEELNINYDAAFTEICRNYSLRWDESWIRLVAKLLEKAAGIYNGTKIRLFGEGATVVTINDNIDLTEEEKAEVIKKVNQEDKDGRTALMYAKDRLEMNPQIIIFLAKNGADPNKIDPNPTEPIYRGMTVLMSVIAGNNLYHDIRKMIKELIKAGADVNVKNDQGKTVLDYAISKIESNRNNLKENIDKYIVNKRHPRRSTPRDYERNVLGFNIQEFVDSKLIVDLLKSPDSFTDEEDDIRKIDYKEEVKKYVPTYEELPANNNEEKYQEKLEKLDSLFKDLPEESKPEETEEEEPEETE